MSQSSRRRADEILVERGLASSRSQARALIMAGEVRSGDRVIDKAGTMLDAGVEIEVVQPPRFVSRGGEKLAHALREFEIDVEGRVCADFGASTGGFTDCLLQAGARRVYAIDVGYGQLAYRLRSDPRIVVMERVNVRYLDALPEAIDIVVIDVSFISLALVLPVAFQVLAPDGICLALVKPQFEAGRENVGRGGVVRDPAIHARVLLDIAHAARTIGFTVAGITASPITGPAGNREFLLFLCRESATLARLEARIEELTGVAVHDEELTQ
jgi:23S rRNA (cytidine1920-2'-O)/16S rRNA (cytidine1409-2'-O)-methyltransferase